MSGGGRGQERVPSSVSNFRLQLPSPTLGLFNFGANFRGGGIGGNLIRDFRHFSWKALNMASSSADMTTKPLIALCRSLSDALLARTNFDELREHYKTE